MKWEAIALWLENPIENRVIVEKYFSDAIINLLTPENGFAIRTLALPVIQCFGIVNNRNEFHARYNTLLNELTNEVNGFGKYIETSEVLVSKKMSTIFGKGLYPYHSFTLRTQFTVIKELIR